MDDSAELRSLDALDATPRDVWPHILMGGAATRLARAVEARDAIDAGHVERMSRHCGLLAHRAGFDARCCGRIEIASRLHDVGKLGVPDSVLLKAGKLDAEEWMAMERHTTAGHDLLAGSGDELLELAATIALSHHERVDGTGYPEGLAGQRVPLEARIAALADVFDALTSDRPYRPRFSVAEALDVMDRERDTHFDPELFDLLSETVPLLEREGDTSRGEAASAAAEILAERDEAGSHQDQLSSERDTAASRHDQAASDRDQAASDRDQTASDESLAQGGDAAEHHAGQRARERDTRGRKRASELRASTALERAATSDARDLTAIARDRLAAQRDEAAQLRDRLADARDAEIAAHDREREKHPRAAVDSGALIRQAARDRQWAADERVRAAAQRAAAAQDRARAAADRQHAARDRTSAGTDELTGALRRGVGLAALAREIDRASRAGGLLVVAFIDVDGLKAVNDADGHAAGDALLVRVSQTLMASMRPSDLVMRFGGDEFVCVLPGLCADLAMKRLRQVSSNLALGPGAGTISVGLAVLEPGDTPDALVARADATLIAARHARRSAIQDGAGASHLRAGA